MCRLNSERQFGSILVSSLFKEAMQEVFRMLLCSVTTYKKLIFTRHLGVLTVGVLWEIKFEL